MKHAVKILSLILFGMLLLVCGFCLGKTSVKTEDTVTFYATVKTVQKSNIDVKGLDVNDINYRGDFSLDVNDKTKVTWHGQDILFSDLKQGDRISVTFSGVILETYPARITSVHKICLLNDN